MKQKTREPRARDGKSRAARSETRLTPPPDPVPVAIAERAAWILFATLALLALARLALGLAPSMRLWGLNVIAFVAPLPSWALWAASALALIPPLARLATPALARAGDAIAGRPWRSGAALVAFLVAMVLTFSDHINLVGDYLLRVGTARGQIPTSAVFPQALPLDLALHYTVPSFFGHGLGGDPNDVSRAIGAIEVALFAGLAVAFARALRLGGVAAAGATAVVVLGGTLGLLTGFAKAFSEMCLITAAFAAFGISVVRDGRGLLPLSIAVSAGLLFHRSALGFLPPLLLVWSLWFRAHGRGGAWRRPAVLVALALPFATLALTLPQILAAIASTDRLHFAREGAGLGHLLGAAFSAGHLADLGNLLLLLSPLALAAPALVAVLGRSLGRRPEAIVLLALLVPLTGLLLFVHPRQGQFRDWDVFAAAGVAVSLVTAWLVGETLRGAPRHAWLAVAVVLGALAPSLQWLMHNHDERRGMARVEAYIAGPPLRGTEERALLHNFLALRHEDFEQFDAAAESYARAAELAPSPRILMEWSMAESNRGNEPAAQRILQGLVVRAPGMLQAWAELAHVSYALGDTAECRRAAEAALRIRPSLTQARDLLNRLASPGGADGAPGP